MLKIKVYLCLECRWNNDRYIYQSGGHCPIQLFPKEGHTHKKYYIK